jgi:hypothetical protein
MFEFQEHYTPTKDWLGILLLITIYMGGYLILVLIMRTIIGRMI